MAKSNKKNTYKIECVTVRKQSTGELDRFGRKVWCNVGEPQVKTLNTTFKDLKVDSFNASKNRKNIHAEYVDRFSVKKTRVLRSVTTVNKDGTKTVQYFRKARNNREN